jgi:hypothetical protein
LPIVGHHQCELCRVLTIFDDTACNANLPQFIALACKGDQCDFAVDIRMGESI